MRTIMAMNAKGGCGKSTLATNLATWFADEGLRVALADCDPQRSSLDWLEARRNYAGIPEIEAIDAVTGPLRAARGTEVLIMDVPARVHGAEVNEMLRRVDHLLVPVLPSPIDTRAAARFVDELLASGRVSRHKTEVAIVANRVREHTHAYQQLEAFLAALEIPVLTHLRESRNYLRAAETGLGIFELAPSAVWQDLPLWDPITAWLERAGR